VRFEQLGDMIISCVRESIMRGEHPFNATSPQWRKSRDGYLARLRHLEDHVPEGTLRTRVSQAIAIATCVTAEEMEAFAHMFSVSQIWREEC